MQRHDTITDLRDLRDLRDLGRRYRVLVLTYRRGAEPDAEDLASTYGSINAALTEANRLQAAADERAEALQYYVVDDHGVPVGRAGGRP